MKYDKTIRKLLVIMKERNRVFEALTATYQMESTDSRMENCLSELLMLVNDIKQCTRRLKADGIEQIPDAKHMSESTDVKEAKRNCDNYMRAAHLDAEIMQASAATIVSDAADAGATTDDKESTKRKRQEKKAEKAAAATANGTDYSNSPKMHPLWAKSWPCSNCALNNGTGKVERTVSY